MKARNLFLVHLLFAIFSLSAFCIDRDTLSIAPLNETVIKNRPVAFQAIGPGVGKSHLMWDLGDGVQKEGPRIIHSFIKPGIFTVTLYSAVGKERELVSAMIIRVHTPETLRIPQVFLDTDARNEVDDQHYIAYCLNSRLDVLGIASVHNNVPGSEKVNYGEIFHIWNLMHGSGYEMDPSLPERIFLGAGSKLEVPASGKWHDTEPIVTEASNALLAAARGATRDHPVWIMPVGPCTNIASAVLQARREGFDLRERIRVFWLGGRETRFDNEYNGGNDPWSVYVMGRSGVDFRVMLAHPASLKLHLDKRTESHLYPENRLGDYLGSIIPVFQWRRAVPKSIHDVCVPAAVKSEFLGLTWIVKEEPAQVSGPDNNYSWVPADSNSTVSLVWDIDGEAMKKDLFGVLNDVPDCDPESITSYKFNKICQENWLEAFHDPCTGDWGKHWFLDGTRATVKNSPGGMSFSAGKTAGNDTCHAVLWTKQSFEGDIRIEYEYTRTDERTANVNIIYIQATGESPFSRDIKEWSETRVVPAMRTYYDHMNTLHLSYAAFDNNNQDREADYVRARRYMPALKNGLAGTGFGESFERTGLFQTGVPHRISVIKKGFDLYMFVQSSEESSLFHWNYSGFPLVENGRVGLRHMYTRGAIYKDFKVFVLQR